jgi:hypothetical protein
MLKQIAAPIAILIILIGAVVPVLNLFKTELVQYHFEQFTGSDIVQTSDYATQKTEQPASFAYLMKNPRTSLKLCLNRLQNSTDSAEKEMVIGLSNDLLKAMRLKPIENHGQWIHQFKTKQSKLYEQLTKTE